MDYWLFGPNSIFSEKTKQDSNKHNKNNLFVHLWVRECMCVDTFAVSFVWSKDNPWESFSFLPSRGPRDQTQVITIDNKFPLNRLAHPTTPSIFQCFIHACHEARWTDGMRTSWYTHTHYQTSPLVLLVCIFFLWLSTLCWITKKGAHPQGRLPVLCQVMEPWETLLFPVSVPIDSAFGHLLFT